MLSQTQTKITFIVHSVVSKQITARKEGAMDNRGQSSEVTDNNYRQKTVNTPKDKRTSPPNDEVIKTRSG